MQPCEIRSTRRWTGVALALLFAVAVGPAGAEKTGTAADVVPGDCLHFNTSLRMKEQFEKVRQSKAVKLLLELPCAQRSVGQGSAGRRRKTRSADARAASGQAGSCGASRHRVA